MCDVNGKFKLCTCSEKIDKKKPYWVLNKGVPKKDERETSILGTLIYSEDEILKEISEERLLQDLNSKNIFDFDYKPSENDILKLYDGNYNYYFIFSKIKNHSKWKVLETGPFSDEKHLFKLHQKMKGFIEGEI